MCAAGVVSRVLHTQLFIMNRPASEVGRLAPDVNKIIFVKNLPFKISSEELYDIFGKFGAIRQIRIGNAKDTRGTGFVVYEDILDAKNAVEHLTGFNVAGRYLTVLYYQPNKLTKKMDLEKKRAELEALKARHGVDGSTPLPQKRATA